LRPSPAVASSQAPFPSLPTPGPAGKVGATVDLGNLLKTSVYDEHLRLRGRMVPFAGYALPVQYAGVVAEHRAVREAAGLFDVSHMGELLVTGPGAQAFLDGLVTNAVHRLPVGKALYTVACREDGGILDDLIVYRLGDDELLVVCNASNRKKIAGHLAAAAEAAGPEVQVEDASDRFGLLALQGPRAFQVLEAAGAAGDPAALKRFRTATGRLAGAEVRFARTGYTGEDGVEIFCPAESTAAVFRHLLDRGQDLGLVPAGLGARDTLRLEASLCLYGQDIDEDTDPLSAGLGWVVKPDGRSFRGQEAIAEIERRGPASRLVGFEMVGRGIARPSYPILSPEAADPDDSDARLGRVTSGSPAPTLGKNVGMGYVAAERSEVGTRLAIGIRGKLVEARIVDMPFYRRPRAG